VQVTGLQAFPYACGGADLQKAKIIKLIKHKNRPIPQNKPVLPLQLRATYRRPLAGNFMR
jgi:hypothetical protein